MNPDVICPNGARINNSQEPLSFSLETLLTSVTLACFAIGLYQLLGSIVVFGVLLILLVVAGVQAYEAGRSFSFWQMIGSAFILLWVLVPQPSNRSIDGVIAFSVFSGIGAWLAYRALVFGHWFTRLLAAIVVLAYLTALASYAVNKLW